MSQHMTFKELEPSVRKYPPTRYMGSKSKLLEAIWSVTKEFEFDSVLDLFSGSGIVGYMFKCAGKAVTSNDYMAMSAVFSKALIENSCIMLSDNDVNKLLEFSADNDHFVATTFDGLYFSNEDNDFIDSVRHNIKSLNDPYKQALATAALIRACTKKRPRGIFTYTGMRYDDGRLDIKKSIEQHFVEAVDVLNSAVFDNRQQNVSSWHDALTLSIPNPDLVYIDPPYFTPKSDNEYVRRYHFVEGLARDWRDVEIQQQTKTKKFRSYPTPFSTLEGTKRAFEEIISTYSSSILVISYSSNSQPSKDEIVSMISRYKEHVTVVPVDYTYTFATTSNVKRNEVQEYIFVGY